jgi:carotenoid cleavage dioxygenase-like enzyme
MLKAPHGCIRPTLPSRLQVLRMLRAMGRGNQYDIFDLFVEDHNQRAADEYLVAAHTYPGEAEHVLAMLHALEDDGWVIQLPPKGQRAADWIPLTDSQRKGE